MKLFTSLLLLGLLCFSQPGLAANLPDQEELNFHVNVFGVMRALDVGIRFTKGDEKDQYIGVLKLKPLGVLKWIVPFSQSQMTSSMRWVPEINRLRLEFFEKETQSRRLYRGVYRFDYVKNELIGQGFFDGKSLNPEVFPLPEDGRFYYEDLLTFLYNVRSGGYGALKPGDKVLIHMIPGKGERTFEVEFLGESVVRDRKSAAEKWVVSLHLNREFYGLKIGEMKIWLSENFSPLRGLAKNVLGWGDVALVSSGH